MAAEIGEAPLDRGHILLAERTPFDAAMHLERAHRCHDHNRVGLETRLAALDVEELLGAEIGPEARLGHHIVGELERRAGRDHAVAAMRDIGERAAMDERRVAFQRLHEVRLQRVLQQHGHRAVRLEVAGRDRRLVAPAADVDLAEPALQVRAVRGEAEDRHDLRGHRDIVARLARETVGDTAERDRDVAQRPVVHVHDAPPGHPAGVQLQPVAPVDVVVRHGRRAGCARRRWRACRR